MDGVYYLMYEGEFKNGMRDGEGQQKKDNGDKFIGRWKWDIVQSGKYIIAADGSQRESQFNENGKEHGISIITHANGIKV